MGMGQSLGLIAKGITEQKNMWAKWGMVE